MRFCVEWHSVHIGSTHDLPRIRMLDGSGSGSQIRTTINFIYLFYFHSSVIFPIYKSYNSCKKWIHNAFTMIIIMYLYESMKTSYASFAFSIHVGNVQFESCYAKTDVCVCVKKKTKNRNVFNWLKWLFMV